MKAKRLFGIFPVFTVLAITAALLACSVPTSAQQPQIAGLTTQFSNGTYSYTMYNNNYWNIYGSNLGPVPGSYTAASRVNVTWATSYIQFGLIQSSSYNTSYISGSSQYWWASGNQLNFFANGQLDVPPGVPISNVTALTANIQVCYVGCSLYTLTGVTY